MSSSLAALVAGIMLIVIGGFVLANPGGARDRAARINAGRAQIGRPTTPRTVAMLCGALVALGIVLIAYAAIS